MPPTLKDIRNVRWGKSFLWDIRFPNESASGDSSYLIPPPAPAPFNVWFPAHTVQEPIYSISTMPITTAIFDMSIPKSLSYSEMTISFYDTVWDHLRDWLWRWTMYMFSAPVEQIGYIPQGGVAVRTLVECIRPVDIMRLSEYGSVIWARRYLVHPSSSLIASLTSDSSPVDYTASFNVVGGMFTLNVPNDTVI